MDSYVKIKRQTVDKQIDRQTNIDIKAPKQIDGQTDRWTERITGTL